MTATDIPSLERTLSACVKAQTDAVPAWHATEPSAKPSGPDAGGLDRFRALVLEQHLANFRIWHREDAARRRDVGDDVIAACKRDIDALNQERNDLIEQVDACLVGLLESLLPAVAEDRCNTETVGMALDRLSILSLKIYHMQEQADREDVDDDHRTRARAKVATLAEQHAALQRGVMDLIADYAAGRKRPTVYFQFKMYNDPRLNPELYRR